MRVCPECGHKDAECWRNVRWCLYEQYCHIGEIDFWDPELYKALTEKWPTEALPLEVPPFTYIITKSRHVKRMATKDYVIYGFHGRQTESWRRTQKLQMEGKQKKMSAYSVLVPPNSRNSLLKEQTK